MRVLYLADFPLPMPYARSIQTLQTCMALGRAGCEVTLLAGRNGHGRAEEWLDWYGLAPHPRVQINQVPVVTSRSQPYHPRWGTYDAQALLAVRRAIMTRAVDLVYVRTPRLARLLALTGLARALPVVHEVHRPYGLAPSYGRRVLRRMRGLVVLTEGARRHVGELLHDHVPLCVARDGAAQPLDVASASAMSHAIYYIGQLHEGKGVDVAMRALRDVPLVTLRVLGGIADASGRQRLQALRRAADQAGVGARVEFLGFVSPRDVPQHLLRAAVLVLPYTGEPAVNFSVSPLKLFEAMVAGKPIVATDLPAIREVLRDGDNAVLVAPDDPQALADGIRRVLDDPALAQRIAASAHRDAAHYTWDRRAEQLMAFFGQVAGRS